MRPSRRSRLTPSPNVTFDAIGTHWQIDTVDPLPQPVFAQVLHRAEEYDRRWSRFRTDSVVHEMATAPGRYALGEDAPALLDLYRDLYEATGGGMSPLVGRVLEQWGYDRAYTLAPAASRAPVPAWDEAIHWDGDTLTTHHPVVLDVGAAGKGHLVDLIGDVLAAAEIDEFTIDASGDILQRGPRTLRVALEHPLDTAKAIGVATVSDGAICASAANRRAWPGAHHIIDAVTGHPTRRVIATWAVSSTALVADGVSTALFFADPAALAERFDVQWVRMLEDQTVQVSEGFSGEVFR